MRGRIFLLVVFWGILFFADVTTSIEGQDVIPRPSSVTGRTMPSSDEVPTTYPSEQTGTIPVKWAHNQLDCDESYPPRWCKVR